MKEIDKVERFLAIRGVMDIYGAVGKTNFRMLDKVMNLSDQQIREIWVQIHLVVMGDYE